MNILLLSQVPPDHFRFTNSRRVFAPFQPQALWHRALINLGHSVTPVNYTAPVLLPGLLTSATLAFKHSLPRLYRRYRRFKSDCYSIFPDNIIRSHRLTHLIRSFSPQVIIISGGISELTPAPLQVAKDSGARIFLLHGVHPRQLSTRFELSHLHLFDWVITNDPTHAAAWAKLGAGHTLALPYSAIDPQLHHRLKLSASDQNLGADVVFVGTLFPDRQKQLSRLTDFNLKIYGDLPDGMPLPTVLNPHYFGPSHGAHMVKVFNASKIVLNFVPPHMPVGGNLRTFEIPGSGAFQLASRCHSDWFIPGREIVLFSSLKDLRSKISHYLKHPGQRQTIADRGYRRTHADHTYRHRFTRLLNLAKIKTP